MRPSPGGSCGCRPFRLTVNARPRFAKARLATQSGRKELADSLIQCRSAHLRKGAHVPAKSRLFHPSSLSCLSAQTLRRRVPSQPRAPRKTICSSSQRCGASLRACPSPHLPQLDPCGAITLLYSGARPRTSAGASARVFGAGGRPAGSGRRHQGTGRPPRELRPRPTTSSPRLPRSRGLSALRR